VAQVRRVRAKSRENRHPNPIRGVNGGGLPWVLDEAHGRLRANGRLKIEVKGLVLANQVPVPENLRGTNPVASFKAIVSCLSTTDGSATNVSGRSGSR
jgi:hypothetical protein